jgi:hypothetical protein
MDFSLFIPEVIVFLQKYPWFTVVSAVVTCASAVAAATKTPKEGTFAAKAYKIIDLLALNILNAKEK